MSRITIYVVVLVLRFTATSQTTLPEMKNLYSFSLVNGATQSKSGQTFGDKQLQNSIGLAHGFNFHYTRVLHPTFDLGAGVGFGVFPVSFRLAPGDDPIFSGPLRSYFGNLYYKGFSRVELLASYRKQLSEKHLLRVQLGGGFVHYGGLNYSSSGTIGTDTTQFDLVYYDLNLEFNKQIKPFFTVGFDLTKTLQNMDLLGLRFSYDHSFRTAFDGTYSLYGFTSGGNYYNRGHYLNVALTYTLTRSKHLQTLLELQKNPSLNKKSAKKVARQNRRYIDPKSMFINASAGMGFGKSIIENDPNGAFVSHGASSFLPRLAFEKGIKNQFYWELGYHSQLFWDVQKFSFVKYSYSALSTFYAHQLSGGALYRWILPNHYNVLNFHGGLTFGFHTDKGTSNGSGNFSGESDGIPFSIQYTSTSKILSNVLSSLYFGFSKDFRIVNNLYLSLSYRQQIGLIKVFETTYTYSGLNLPYTEGVRSQINGTSQDFQLGFKVKI
jgi:hypothetical protein